jgi:hypothetical protein
MTDPLPPALRVVVDEAREATTNGDILGVADVLGVIVATLRAVAAYKRDYEISDRTLTRWADAIEQEATP